MKPILAASLLLLAAAPVHAQAPICGGISLVGEWIGGTEAASDVATAETPFDADGQVPIAGHLVRMFALSEPADVAIEVAARPDGDPYIAVYDTNGTEVAADDDSGGDFASLIETTLEAGTYCLAARSYAIRTTDVAIRVGRADQPPLLEDASAPDGGTGAGCGDADMAMLGTDLDAEAIAAGIEGRGTAADRPGWGFTLAEPTAFTATARSVAGDPLLRLRDAAGEVLTENDDSDGLNSRIDRTTPLVPGEYCLEVEDLRDGDNEIAVALAPWDADADRRRRLDAAEFAPSDADGVEIEELGTLASSNVTVVTASDAASWLRFDLPQGGLLVAEAIGGGIDPTIVLFDRVGRRVAENDDGPTGLDSFLATRLAPGTYMLAVRLVADGTAGPVRLLLERYVPAP
ncbi:MAG: DVUA0089 family protein [Jannaschia sp.]